MSDTFDAPGSRNEAILQNMLGANNPLEPPGSRIEDLLQQLLEEGSGSGLPDVTSADDGSVLRVVNGAWGKGNNIHWLEGGSTYLPYTTTFLATVMDAIPVMLQNNYMSYTVAVVFDSTVDANVAAMAGEIYEAFVCGETPIYRSTGITDFYDMICPLKYASFDPTAPESKFDLLFSGFVYYAVSGAGYFAANAEVSIARRNEATRGMFIKFDRLVDGAHS